MQLLRTYSNVAAGFFLAVIGSGGFLEVSINQGDAAGRLKAKASKKIKITPVED
jgi:S-adenosylmethionine hydrolase